MQNKAEGIAFTNPKGGSGCDGAAGCRMIKARGGVTIAQNENTSYQFAMSKAAIDAGIVDYVLPVEHIAGKIVSLTSREAW